MLTVKSNSWVIQNREMITDKEGDWVLCCMPVTVGDSYNHMIISNVRPTHAGATIYPRINSRLYAYIYVYAFM